MMLQDSGDDLDATRWPPMPVPLDLAPGEISVVRVNLDRSGSIAHQLFMTLSPEERDRAAQLVAKAHRVRFIVAHGMLRQVLGAALGCEPVDVDIRVDEMGKPNCVSRTNPDLCFNLSHTDDLALVGLTRGRAIGIDVERVRRLPDALQLAQRYLHTRESSSLALLPSADLDRAFFAVWTQKEAYLKARGLGLRIDLASFAVNVPRTLGPDILQGLMCGPDGWFIQQINLGHSHAAAVSCEGIPVSLSSWHA